MKYTEKVNSYTLKVPTFGGQKIHCSIISVNVLDIEKFLSSRDIGCEIEDNGLIDATIVYKNHSPLDTTTFGYKLIHTSRDSRGSFSSDLYVPCDWDENHPIVMKIKGTAKEEAKAEESYYSRLWV